MQASILSYQILNNLRNYTNNKILLLNIFMSLTTMHSTHWPKVSPFPFPKKSCFSMLPFNFTFHLFTIYLFFLEIASAFLFLALHYISTTDPHHQHIHSTTLSSSFPMETPLGFQPPSSTLLSRCAFLKLLNKI